MNRGLLLKSARETLVLMLILSAALLLMEAVMSAVMPGLVNEFSVQLLQIPFVTTMFQALLGTDISEMGPEAILAVSWVHPIVLAIVFTYPIVHCTRVPAGEIDRGTIDVMFGLPVSRWRVYIAETVVFLAWSAILILLGLLGFRLGMQAVEPGLRPPIDRLLAIVANLYCLCLAVGGLACLVSSMSERRGRAIATVFGILIASFLQSFLAQFWTPAAKLSFLSLLSYYQPLTVLRGSGSLWPVGDMIVLTLFGLATWAAGGWWFARRDICTV